MCNEYYLRNGFVGNDFLFWRKNKAGYTTNIDDAHIFTKQEAFRQHEMRNEDVPIEKPVVDKLAHRALSSEKYFYFINN